MGNRRGAYKFLVGRNEGMSPLVKLKRKWKNNVKIDHQKLECGGTELSNWLRIGISGGLL
jgi:hypothetical protein